MSFISNKTLQRRRARNLQKVTVTGTLLRIIAHCTNTPLQVKVLHLKNLLERHFESVKYVVTKAVR